jgi:hypothetical protein
MKRDDKDQPGGFETVGETLGGLAGKMAGRATDLAMNVANTMLTSVFQAMGEWWTSPAAQQATASFSEGEESACREDFETRSGRGGTAARDYESVRPLYQFGFVARQNPAYQGKQFDEIEEELQRGWESAARHGFKDWSEAREYVNYGYTYRTPGAPNPS